MKDGSVAYDMMRSFGLGITNVDLAKIPVGIEKRFEDEDDDNDGLTNKLEEALKTDPNNQDSDNDSYKDGEEILNGYNPLDTGKLTFDAQLANRLNGRILLQVESRGEAWYIYPEDGKRYYMKDGEAAYQIMRYLSLGITTKDLASIYTGSVPEELNDTNDEMIARDIERVKSVEILGAAVNMFKYSKGYYPDSPNSTNVLGEDILCMYITGFVDDCLMFGSSLIGRHFMKEPIKVKNQLNCDSNSTKQCNYAYKKLDNQNFEIYVFLESIINDKTKTGLHIIKPGTQGGLSGLPQLGNDSTKKKLTMLFPNGGEKLFRGETYEIKWLNQNLTNQIEIYLLKNGKIRNELSEIYVDENGQLRTILEVPPLESGPQTTHLWKLNNLKGMVVDNNNELVIGDNGNPVLELLPDANDYSILILEFGNKEIFDESDTYFSISTHSDFPI